MFVLNSLLEHKLLFGIILIIILINLGCILYLVIKERRKDREEINDIVSSLSNAKPREDEIPKPVLPVVEEKTQNKAALEIEKVLEKMQKDLEATPEEVVTTFEKEQEEKSIISYQELVSSLKKEEPVKQSIVEALKQEMIEEVNLTNDNIDVIDIEDEVVVKQVEPTLTIEEPKKEVYKKKFKNTDFISPIFGKLETGKQDYPTVPQFSREEKLEELFEEVPIKRTRSMKKAIEETLDIEPLQEEIRKNDEFLRSLKNFRSNL